MSEVMAILSLAKRLNSELLPTLGLPKIATFFIDFVLFWWIFLIIRRCEIITQKSFLMMGV